MKLAPRMVEALALVRKLYPVEAAQSGGHLEREIHMVAFGVSLTPRGIAKRWRSSAIEASETIAPPAPVATLAIVPETAPSATVASAKAPRARKARPALIAPPPASKATVMRALERATAAPARFTFTPPASWSPAQVEAFRRKLAAPPVARTPRTISIETHGERALARDVEAPADRAVKVRISYESMGGETLVCDTDPMPPASARRMVCEINATAINVCNATAQVVAIDSKATSTHSSRFVVFPSQRSESPATAEQMEIAA